MSEYVEAALRLGLDEIAFTDHIPLPNRFDEAHRMRRWELDRYVESVLELISQYPDIKIRCGIEADYYEGFESYTASLLDQYPFDLVIMSVHFLKHWPGNNWVFAYDFPGKSISEVYADYLRTVRRGVKSGLFDIAGHIDIIKAPGDSLVSLIPDEVIHTLETIRDHGMVLEINTSGYRKKTGESYPGEDWIDLIKDIHVPLTLGSDAHHPDQVALAFDKAREIFKRNGINRLTRFEKREPFNYDLS